jgi:hypothetical protein
MPAKKYATPEEAKEAKRLKTLESNRRKREEKKALAPEKVKEKAPAKPRAKKAKTPEPESETDEEFENMLFGTATPKAMPVSSGFHDLIAFLEQDHGEVVPVASQRPQPQPVVRAVAAELARAHSDNIQRAEAKQESVLPAYPIEEKKQIETERVQRDIVAERRKAFREKVIANRIAKQAELRGEKVNKGNIVWSGSPKYSVDDNYVKPAVSPPFPAKAPSTEPFHELLNAPHNPISDEAFYSATGYTNLLSQDYENGNLQPRVQKKSRFTSASPTEHLHRLIEHFKPRRIGDLRDQYGRPEYGNLKPPVLAPKPKFSILHPMQIEHIPEEEANHNINRILREEHQKHFDLSPRRIQHIKDYEHNQKQAEQVHKAYLKELYKGQPTHKFFKKPANVRIAKNEAQHEKLLNLIRRPRTPRAVTPKVPKATPKAKVATPKVAEPSLNTILSTLKEKHAKAPRSDLAQMKTRLKRLETSLKNGKNIEKKQAEIETLKLQIGDKADLTVKQHKERLEKLGVVPPSEVVKRRNKHLADLGEKQKAEDIKAKHDARIAKKVAAEEAKANKKLAKQGIVVLGEAQPYKSYQQLLDEQKLEQLQSQGSFIPDEEEQAFLDYFKHKYGSIPLLYKEPVKRANAKPDYRQRGETFTTYKGRRIYKYS